MGLLLFLGSDRHAGPAAQERAWREAPEYVALFAPAGRAAAYRAWTTPQPLEAILETLSGNPALLRTPGAWEPRRLGPLDAFGRSGPYDRSRLARLYGARTVTVARGALSERSESQGQVWSLLSPYPDPALERLQTGTLVLVLTLP